ncbi:ComEC/Rec2 family competence protein [Ammoniphilus resinae]|uniref:Beta-lactamase superfamily II metal-dependent hydrolase n=1 Tax=Ammoniphilus resinae TaxID=861532 RepID=A0ABS4GT29_9BACL|nr:hypothetical protein [Ammoniphilus resinae]MBP1933404.1 beta-lactamase superfamily II metal-dependent hydrolase [Ammoniphilus resinae]
MGLRFGLLGLWVLLLVLSACQAKEQTIMATHHAPVEIADFPVSVHFLGISEGESTLVLAKNFTMLVDAGSAKSANEIIEILEQFEVERIDTLVLTGEMDGHVDGANTILQHYPVDQLMVPELIQQTILERITQPVQSIVAVTEGQTFTFAKILKMRVLSPSEPLSLSPQANSLVFQLIHDKVKWMFTSDINDEIEYQLIEKYNLKSQILKVSDSGSNQASSPSFLEKVDAHVAVIFQDLTNTIGFDDVIERLNETWLDVYQTKTHGTVSVLSDGRDYQIKREKSKGFFQEHEEYQEP